MLRSGLFEVFVSHVLIKVGLAFLELLLDQLHGLVGGMEPVIVIILHDVIGLPSEFFQQIELDILEVFLFEVLLLLRLDPDGLFEVLDGEIVAKQA